jgi:glycosyltransferase involved in cell wall biosynthesis
MKPLLINTSDAGGAGKACLRIHLGLIQNGIESKVLIKERSGHSIEHLYEIQQKENFILKKSKLFFNLIQNYSIKELHLFYKDFKNNEELSFPFHSIRLLKEELFNTADLINLHWVSNLMDYRTFFKNCKKPVIWTLHDMYPFSGRKHYDQIYHAIDEKGYPTKRMVSKTELKLQEKIIQYKKEALSHIENLTVICPSDWLAKEAKKSLVFRNRDVHVIRNGIDTETFNLHDKYKSRKDFGIPADKTVLLFVADSITNFRKGFIFLKRALETIKDNNLFLLIIGQSDSSINTDIQLLNLGYVSDDIRMSKIYSAADAFIIPSLADNLPNTIVESLMCGTPVIAFPSGGIPEMIEHEKNGLLCEEISVQSLRSQIMKFLDIKQSFSNTRIRTDAEKKYNVLNQSAKYAEVFNSVL